MKNVKLDNNNSQSDINSSNSGITIDTEIARLLNIHTLLRKERLIETLIESTGKSRRTIERRLRDAIKRNVVIKVKQNQLEDYGYGDPNKNAVYIASKEILRAQRSLESIFEMLTSNELENIKFGVAELRNFQTAHYRDYLLNEKERSILIRLVDKLSKNKKLDDIELVNNLFMFINNEINKRRARIFEGRLLLGAVKRILEFFPSQEFYGKANSPLAYLIYTLGIYNDEGVIDRLEEDAEKCDAKTFKGMAIIYSQKFTAKIIVENEIPLRIFKQKLQREGKVEVVTELTNISYAAFNNLRMISSDYEEYLLE